MTIWRAKADGSEKTQITFSPLEVDGFTWSPDEKRFAIRARNPGGVWRIWVTGFQHGIVKVSVADVRVEHQVRLTDFTKWLERTNASSPREMAQRQRLRAILGMPAR